MKNESIGKAFFAFLSILAVASLCSVLAGQEILLRRGDKIEIVVPQRQDLCRDLVINDRGAVYIPVVGGIVLDGMTLKEAEVTLLRRLRETYPSIQNITVSLIEEESRGIIYVHGAVVRPGKYELMSDLNLWDAIREAGGSTATASLVAVRLIRAEGEGNKTSIINIQPAIESGEFGSLPVLRAGDTVIVPEMSMKYQGSGAVNVIGAVVNPGPYNLSGNKTLIDAILSAGGPMGNANLGEVKIVRYLPEGGTLTLRVDFKKYLNEGDDRHNPVILMNDTVNVPRHSNFLHTMFTDPRFLIGLITTAGTIAAVLITRTE